MEILIHNKYIYNTFFDVGYKNFVEEHIYMQLMVKVSYIDFMPQNVTSFVGAKVDYRYFFYLHAQLDTVVPLI